MTMRSLLVAGALTVASLSLASAKTYDISISDPALVGTLRLQPGQYKVALKGSQAIFTNEQDDKKFTAPVKVESVNKKYVYTAVETNREKDGEHVQFIDLGGSKTRLQFE